jgi:beta-glucanase (GH16 family)
VPMYLLAGLAVGGTWGGNPDATTTFPARLEIDSIRVWSPPAPLARGSNGKGPKPKAARLKG